MKTPHFPDPKLSPASEYAVILGAGATAAVSIAAQQVAVAALPLTTLVALGLLNRYRLDQRLQASEPEAQGEARAVPAKPISPRPKAARPQPEAAPTPAAPAAVNFSTRPSHLHESLAKQLQARANALAIQQASLQKVGSLLRQVREDKALSLEDIYQRTFIQPYNLRAIENGHLHQLPEPFYIRAFIQKYASALGLEGATLAADFPLG